MPTEGQADVKYHVLSYFGQALFVPTDGTFRGWFFNNVKCPQSKKSKKKKGPSWVNFPGSVVTSHRHPRGTMEALSHKTDLVRTRNGPPRWNCRLVVLWREGVDGVVSRGKKKSTKCCKLHSFRRNLVEVGGWKHTLRRLFPRKSGFKTDRLLKKGVLKTNSWIPLFRTTCEPLPLVRKKSSGKLSSNPNPGSWFLFVLPVHRMHTYRLNTHPLTYAHTHTHVRAADDEAVHCLFTKHKQD